MSASGDKLVYRPYEPGDENAILDLFEKSFSRRLPSEYWRWRFTDNPAGAAVIFLAWHGGVLAGHYAVSRILLNMDDRSVPSGLSGTTMTHPEYRGLGLFPELARRTYEEMRRLGMMLVWGFPNANSHRGFIQDLGWKDVYEIPTLRLSLSSQAMPDPVPNVIEIENVDARFDALWERVRRRYSVSVMRDSRYLSWRFLRNPSERYKLHAFAEGDRVRGYVFVKRYKNELQITDILAEEVEIALQLIYATSHGANQQGVTSLATWLPVTSPIHRAFEKLGFQNDLPVTYFGGLILRDLDAATINSPFSWFYTMGDSDVY